jgi:hypothetical protein
MGIKPDKCMHYPIKTPYCNQTSVSSDIPLLMDVVRGQRVFLDRAPHMTNIQDVETDDIYTREISQYGKGYYNNYEDIDAGQIQYWISEDSGDAFDDINFVTPNVIDHTITVDPMGVVRPEYTRATRRDCEWNECNPQECLSSSHDALTFRQDMMERQMRKRNEQEYTLRWSKHKLGY